MEDLINKFISKKLRKKEKDYQLSENSRVTAQDFGRISSMASKIYRYLVAISPKLRNGDVFNELVSLLRQIKNKELELSIEESRQHTHMGMLAGFSLNKKASWASMLPWQPEISFATGQDQVQIGLPENKAWNLKKFPDRLSRIEIAFHAVVINLEQPKEEEASAYSCPLFIRQDEEDHSARTALQLDLFRDSLIIVIAVVRYHIFDTQGTGDDYVSGRAQYHATDILQAYHVREGQLLKNMPDTDSRKKPTSPFTEGSAWV